jgi:hypothetical protein
MRQVTNTVGTIVFNNDDDAMAAEEAWQKLRAGKLEFPKRKKNHTFYIEVDEAMLPTRQEDGKGSVYKENKLGMVFSSDNFYWWKDKHGKRQHQILKREYTSLIGDNINFGKLLLSVAIKNDYGKYKDTVLLSDGATCIINMHDLLFQDS